MSNEHDNQGGESAEEALRNIVEGFQRFRDEVYPQQAALFKTLAHEQAPRAMFITCANSRIALGAHQPDRRLRLAAKPQAGRGEIQATTAGRKTLAYDFFRIL